MSYDRADAVDRATSNELLDIAAHLCAETDLARPLALEPLAGGKNNRVFKVTLNDGAALVLKSYFHDPRDPRDRLAAEWAFLSYAWTRGVRDVPRPIARRCDRHVGLFSLVPGRCLLPSQVSAGHLDAAAAFIVAVNGAPRSIEELAPGSEACFSLAQHVATIERRLARLTAIAPEAADREHVQRFVAERLMPSWMSVRAMLERSSARAGMTLDEPLAAADVIASPSDFGFHNALFDPADGRLRFIDFEYAGRDDPAKLVCDFFCQPEVPAPQDQFARFVDQIADGLVLGEVYRDRCRLLRDLYRIKWAVIILNQFMPLGATRRAFAAHEADAGARQIARAEAQLTAIAA